MNAADAAYFACLFCGGPLELSCLAPGHRPEAVQEGVLACQACRIFFAISEGIPLLIDRGYIPDFDLEGFRSRWQGAFDFSGFTAYEQGTNQAKMRQMAFFNQDAEYDDDVSESPFWRAADANILRAWMEQMPRQGAVVDLGCGTGRVTIPLSQAGCRVMGSDISLGMLKRAQAKAEAAGAGPITFFLADAEHLPLLPGRFAAVVSYGMLHHVDKPESILAEAQRILAPGGRFFALENHESVVRFIFDFLMRLNRLWVEEAGSHPLFKVQELIDLARAAGLVPQARTSIFLPPHLLNRLGYASACRIIGLSDRLFGRLPLIRQFGGQVVLEAVKPSGLDSEVSPI
ncbi:MAG: class I SAM-dependent methyltransferase [Desulfarculus sp.]|jgi:SAM-dependent methyltransferase|nr:MAG: class I SAM-dependent methyltransferase [Desulfarculus sp.]